MTRLIAIIFISILAFGQVTDAPAAEVVVNGKDLEGSVIGVTAKGVEFQTVYGEGTIVIAWSDVDGIRSDKEFLILLKDEETVVGRIWGVADNELLVGASPASAARIPVDRIYRSLTRAQYEQSLLDRLRVRYRYWEANFDLGYSYTDATTDATAFATGLELRRRKKPTEFSFSAFYRFNSTRSSGESRQTNENIALGRTRLDYDLSERVFIFGIATAEYNEVQSLSLRFDPTVGPGYRFVDSEDLQIKGRTGPGYVYQRFFGGETDNFFTILFGGDLDANLPYGSKLRMTAEYLPKVTDWENNYVIRGLADWTMPIIGWLDFKLSIINTYNNQAAEDTQRNSFTSTLGLSFRF